MLSTTDLLDLFRMHVRAALAWEQGVLRRVGLLPPSRDGMFDNLAVELFARWPAEAQDHKAALRCEGIR